MLGSALMKGLSENYEAIGLDVRKPAPSANLSSNSIAHSNATGDSLLPDNKLLGKQAVPIEPCDITHRASTLRTIERVNPGLIIHAAAWTDVDGCESDSRRAKEININGTENVVLGAEKANAGLLYISTDFVFDGLKKIPYSEKDAPNPLNVYAMSKLEGEKRVGILKNFVILRTSWLFGANGSNFVDAILKATKNRKELKVVDDQTGSPTYAADLALAIVKLLECFSRKTKGGVTCIKEIYHISNSGQVSWFEYAKKILEIAGIKNIRLIRINANQLGRPAKRPAFSVLDNSKFEKATGFKMRPWQEALAEYLKIRYSMLTHGECT